MNQRDMELLSAYLDGQTSPSDAAHLEARLASDPALVSALEDLRESRDLLRRLPHRRAPRNFTLTPQMVGRKPPLPRAYPVLRFATAFAAFLFAVSFLRVGPIALGASAPAAPEYGIGGGGPGEPAALEAEAAPTEAPVATEAPMQAMAPEPTAQPTAGPLPTEMALVPPAAAPTEMADQNRAAEPPGEPAAKSAEQPPIPEPFPLSAWQIAFGILTLLGAASLFLIHRLAARKWRIK